MKHSTLKEFMSPEIRRRLGNRPTYHVNCIQVTERRGKGGEITEPGIARPGKTARDRAKRQK